jgi:hypothetical protein
LEKLSDRGGFNMKRKAISIWVTSIMIAAIFTVVLVGNVSAISNDHNLSGIVWQSDGSAPTGATDFCIWVEHTAGSGTWNRFPTTGWVQTEQGVDGNWWYSYGTLPGPDSPSGDPQPFPYNPSNPANSQNVLNYSAGGGIFNEQQWDVRTVAPIDIAPTNITVEGMIPALWEPAGMPATPNMDLPIYFNVTNFGSVPSGDFYVSIWNCTSTGTNIGGVPIDEFLVSSIPGGGDTGVLLPPINWYAPLIPGDYYVNITVDSQGQITEFNEANNRQILHFIVGPELVIVDLLVNGAPPTIPVYVGPGDTVMILAKAKNDGSTPTGAAQFDLTIYNTTGFGGPRIPGSEVSNSIDPLDALEESPVQVFLWQAPLILGDYYINISVDFSNAVLETDENNNEISIHFNVPPIPVTTIWSGNPVHVETIYWYVTSTTDLNFTVSSFNPPPYYTWYMITDDTKATVVKPWANYTAEGMDFNLGAWGEDTYRITYYSIDSVNAVEGWKNKTIIVDDSNPLTSVGFGGPRYRATVSDNMNITSQTPITLTGQDNPLGFSIAGVLNASGIGDEPGSGMFYRILRQSDNLVMVDWTQSTFFTVVDGIYTANPFTFGGAWLDGLYRIEYYSIDNLGHTESVKSTIVNLDNTAPVKGIDYGLPNHRENPGDMWNISSASDITLTADDGSGSGVNRTEYRVWNPFFDSGWVTYSTPFSISNSWTDGIYTIDYNSTDNLGNDLTDSDIFYLDNTGPISSVSGNPWTLKFLNNYEVNSLTVFTMDADDGDGSGWDEIEYRLDSNPTWILYTAPVNFSELISTLTPDEIPWNHTIHVRAHDYLGNIGPETDQLIYIEGDIAPPLPPVLRLYLNDNDDHVRLEWEPSESQDVDHYLIYKSTTKNGFDFATLLFDTNSADSGGVTDPLRTTWNDVNAAQTGKPDYYYIMRSVDNRGNIGYTSNMVGKTTLTFEKGYNTFALPLKPFEDTVIMASDILDENALSDDADTIYRYDTNSQQWMGKAKKMPVAADDFTLNFGEGYMLYVAEGSAQLTFTGSTGSTIRFIEGIGEEETFRNSLSAQARVNGIELNWGPELGATGYAIYRGEKRLGENSLNDFSLEPEDIITGTQTTWTDTSASGNEYYYLVVAMEGTMEGASTYSVGVKKVTLSEGYSLISLELEPKIPTGAGRFLSDMVTQKSSTLFYYDNAIGNWRGHPSELPENINNGEVNTGFAYIVYVDAGDVNYVYTGR